MHPAQVNWNEANVAKLKEMWKAGAAVREMAETITGSGENRNMILGKAHRLKLGPHPNASLKALSSAKRRSGVVAAKKQRAPKPPKAKPPAVVIEKIKPIPVVNDNNPIDADMRFLKSRAWQPLPDTNPVPLDALGHAGRDNICHWPLGDGPFMFCGAHAEDGKVYCQTHNHLSTRRL